MLDDARATAVLVVPLRVEDGGVAAAFAHARSLLLRFRCRSLKRKTSSETPTVFYLKLVTAVLHLKLESAAANEGADASSTAAPRAAHNRCQIDKLISE